MPAMVCSQLRSSIHNLALGTQPIAEMGMAKKANRDTSVSRGWSKNHAISGAQRKSIIYKENPAMMLNQATAL